jgi:hypothetical protein
MLRSLMSRWARLASSHRPPVASRKSDGPSAEQYARARVRRTLVPADRRDQHGRFERVPTAPRSRTAPARRTRSPLLVRSRRTGCDAPLLSVLRRAGSDRISHLAPADRCARCQVPTRVWRQGNAPFGVEFHVAAAGVNTTRLSSSSPESRSRSMRDEEQRQAWASACDPSPGGSASGLPRYRARPSVGSSPGLAIA